ncbi:1,4-alpha-glucan branching enzyme [Rhizobium sp. UR51a]|jgi:hypothetical protein|nr:1,4-alpha-glucan branching enzyme [Rhizobium sp. UR51a]
MSGPNPAPMTHARLKAMKAAKTVKRRQKTPNAKGDPGMDATKTRRTTMTESATTTDHDTIRKWAEQRDGHPAKVDVTGDGGILRIDFGEPEDALKAISWDEFFEIFEDRKLAFLYQDRTSGGESRFNKFISR